MVKATFAALTGMTSPRQVAARRNKRVSDILPTKQAAETAETEAA